jgi:hypothetical protein
MCGFVTLTLICGKNDSFTSNILSNAILFIFCHLFSMDCMSKVRALFLIFIQKPKTGKEEVYETDRNSVAALVSLNLEFFIASLSQGPRCS